jgi:hypothetical protein
MTAVDPAFAPVVAAFARTKGVTAAPMFASVGLRVDAGFFAVGIRGALLLKLPAARVGELVESGIGEPFRRGDKGPVMKEWVLVPPGHADWIALAKEAQRSLAVAKPRRRK